MALDTGALKSQQLTRITVDTTVMPKNVTHPTDAKLMMRALEKLNALARQQGIVLRQSYLRVGKRAVIMAGRYAHACQFKRQKKQLGFLRNRLGRVCRDIRRSIEDDDRLKQAFATPLSRADQIRKTSA